jgi:hypothetical protein
MRGCRRPVLIFCSIQPLPSGLLNEGKAHTSRVVGPGVPCAQSGWRDERCHGSIRRIALSSASVQSDAGDVVRVPPWQTAFVGGRSQHGFSLSRANRGFINRWA